MRLLVELTSLVCNYTTGANVFFIIVGRDGIYASMLPELVDAFPYFAYDHIQDTNITLTWVLGRL